MLSYLSPNEMWPRFILVFDHYKASSKLIAKQTAHCGCTTSIVVAGHLLASFMQIFIGF
jgi:hypothetical protein